MRRHLNQPGIGVIRQHRLTPIELHHIRLIVNLLNVQQSSKRLAIAIHPIRRVQRRNSQKHSPNHSTPKHIALLKPAQQENRHPTVEVPATHPRRAKIKALEINKLLLNPTQVLRNPRTALFYGNAIASLINIRANLPTTKFTTKSAQTQAQPKPKLEFCQNRDLPLSHRYRQTYH